jgi:hypothetical protein
MTAKEQLFSRPSQLEKSFCDACAKKHNQAKNIEVPCRIRECGNSWVWTEHDQKRFGRKNPPKRLCSSCYEEQKKLSDISVECKVKGCSNHYVYTPLLQLLDRKAGKPSDYRPRRMCPSCMEKLNEYKPVQVPCKIRGCKKSWEFTPYAQLEYYAEKGADAPLPHRMCQDCFTVYNAAKDESIECKNKGCHNTWVYNRTMAVMDKVRGKESKHRMCKTCFDLYNELEDIELPCQYKKYGCEQTSVLGKYPQLIAELNKKPNRAYQLCESCLEFISNAKEISRECTSCGASISFTPHEQLLEKLGKFTPSTQCPNCLGRELKEATAKEGIKITHHAHVVKLPSKGPWNSDRMISSLPPYITHTKLDELVDAEVVITVFSNEFAMADEEEKSWPYQLEQLLRERHPEFKTVVMNSSIATSSTEQALARIERDLAPFKSDAVIFSFDHADVQVKHATGSHGFVPVWDQPAVTKASDELFATIARHVKGHKAYMTPTPVIPSFHPPEGLKRVELSEWESALRMVFNKRLAHSRSCAHTNGIPIIDVAARFGVNVEESSKKWMKDWFSPNDHGLRNIINWAADFVESTGIYE